MRRGAAQAGVVLATALVFAAGGRGVAQPAATRAEQAKPAEPAGSTSTGAPANAPPDAAYQQVVTDAVAEYDRGNWAEARASFLRAHELAPSARTWRTLGMTAFELRDYAQAMRELAAALSDERRPLDADKRAEVEALLERTRAYVGRIRVALDPPDAALFVDDRPAAREEDGSLLLPLGEHVLRAEAAGHSSRTRRLTIQGREDESVELRLDPALPAAAAPTATTAPAAATTGAGTEFVDDTGGLTWTWVAAAGAVAFGGAAIGLGLAAGAEHDDLKQACADMPGGACVEGDPTRDVDDSKLSTLETLTNVSIGLAAASAVGAVILYLVESDGDSGARVETASNRLALRGRF